MSDPALMIELLELHAKEDAARITELEAVVQSRAAVLAELDHANARIAELEAQRDRLKAALTEIVNDEEGDYDLLVYIARAALSGEGVTK